MNEAEFEKKYVDAGGIRTCYIEAGQGEPVILIHGGGAGANGYGNWFSCLPRFGKRFRAIAVDMVGFGNTDGPDPAGFEYSHKARYDHIAAFIRALGLPKATLVGNSMGGATSIGVAVEHPQLVDKLVLMGSAGLSAEITEALMPVLGYDYTREGMIRLIKVLTNKNFPITDEMVDYRHRNSVDPKNKAAYAATMDWVRRQGGLFYDEAFIARVSQPTLVVNGKDDLVVTLKQAYRYLEIIPNSWGYILPHCGHWAMIERPDDFTAAVGAFIETH